MLGMRRERKLDVFILSRDSNRKEEVTRICVFLDLEWEVRRRHLRNINKQMNAGNPYPA